MCVTACVKPGIVYACVYACVCMHVRVCGSMWDSRYIDVCRHVCAYARVSICEDI